MSLAMVIRKRDIDRRVWNVHRRNDLWIDAMMQWITVHGCETCECLESLKREMIAVTPFTGSKATNSKQFRTYSALAFQSPA